MATEGATIQTPLQTVAQRFEQGRQLEQSGKVQEALAAFNQCLELASRSRLSLPLTTFSDILLSIAFCYADQARWDLALRLYQNIEHILRQVPDWQKLVPPGLQVALPPGFDPGLPLAVIYDSMAIAHDHAGDEQKALLRYRQAIDLYARHGQHARAFQSWLYMAIGRRQREQWDKLVDIAQQMLELAFKLDDPTAKIKSWQFLVQAHANRNEPIPALNYLKLAVETEYKLGHPDFERDQAILKDLISKIKR